MLNNYITRRERLPIYRSFTWNGLHCEKPHPLEFRRRWLGVRHLTGTTAWFGFSAKDSVKTEQGFQIEWRFRQLLNSNTRDLRHGRIDTGGRNKVSVKAEIQQYLNQGDYSLDVRLSRGKEHSSWAEIAHFDVILRDAWLNNITLNILVGIIFAMIGAGITLAVTWLATNGQK